MPISARAATCPTCGAGLSPKAGSRTVTCGYCKSEVVVEGAEKPDTATLFPNFRQRPIPCPNCEKKALRPRVRTRDFRCQACSEVFEGEYIEELIDRMIRAEDATDDLADILRGLMEREIPKAYWVGSVSEPKKDESSAPGCLGCLGMIMVGGLAFIGLAGWSMLARVGIAGGVGLVFGLGIIALVSSMIGPSVEEKRAALRAQWEASHPLLVELRDALGGLLLEAVEEAVEAVMDKMNDDGTDSEEYEKLAEPFADLDEDLAKDKLANLIETGWGANSVEAIVSQYGTDDEKAAYASCIAEWKPAWDETPSDDDE